MSRATNRRLRSSRAPVQVRVVGRQAAVVVSMEMGCDAAMSNTAIAEARDPIRMARAMRHVIRREGYLAGRVAMRQCADPSPPLAGRI